MIKQSKARIFLAGERGLNETEWFRSQNTFNFGKYNNEHKQPFGNIYVLNDDMLAGGRSLSMIVEDDTYLILLPVSGAITFRKQNEEKRLIVAGQILVRSAKFGDKIEIGNPFAEDAVNFLQIWIRCDKPADKLNTGALTFEDINTQVNKLVKIFPGNVFNEGFPFSISIGKFSGRGETVYTPTAKAGCFLFVLNGAFETEGRLLHERDGLALWETNEIDMEALSNDAMILLIETT